jgi:hypothetical protein
MKKILGSMSCAAGFLGHQGHRTECHHQRINLGRFSDLLRDEDSLVD